MLIVDIFFTRLVSQNFVELSNLFRKKWRKIYNNYKKKYCTCMDSLVSENTNGGSEDYLILDFLFVFSLF